MVGKCMREGDNFVVTMSRVEGFADLGCEVSICDFDQLSNGLLSILAIGERKQQLFNPRQREDGLWFADAGRIFRWRSLLEFLSITLVWLNC